MLLQKVAPVYALATFLRAGAIDEVDLRNLALKGVLGSIAHLCLLLLLLLLNQEVDCLEAHDSF